MLDQEQVEKIRATFHTAGWREVIKPATEAKMNQTKQLLFLLPSERPKPYQDLDEHTGNCILKGEVKAYEWLLSAFQNEIVVSDVNRQRDELARQQANGEPAPATIS